MRELAAELGVNPNTVAAAYRTLRDRGVIETAGRRGSRVRQRPVTAPRESLRVEPPEGGTDISTGNPDPALLPPLAAAFAAAADRAARDPVLYGAADADPGFAASARAALDADGVPGGPLAVTSGSLDAIERVLAAHLRPGDAVAVEDPGWGSLLDLVPALGLRPLPVAVDDDGPLPAELARAFGQGARAVIVTDRAQNPTGAAVSAGRAHELRAVLRDHPATLLIEDDHGHGIVDLPLRPLAGATRHWALVRSTAKGYGPDLRLAVLTGDPLTVDRVRGRQRLGPGWVSHLLQQAVRTSVGDRRDRPGPGGCLVRCAAYRPGGGARRPRRRRPGAQWHERMGAGAGGDRPGGAAAPGGLGGCSRGSFPARLAARTAADRLAAVPGRHRPPRRRPGSGAAPGRGRTVRLTRGHHGYRQRWSVRADVFGRPLAKVRGDH